MIRCKELNKDFDSKDALFLALKENKDAIIKQKKSELKETRSTELPLVKDFDFEAPFETEKGYFYAIINSTNILDSHGDVHADTIWNKSAKEQNGRTYYVADHELKIGSIICNPKDVEIQLHKTTFKDIGYDLEGETTLLVYKMPIDAIRNDNARRIIENKEQMENSIRMEYVDMILCIKTDLEELKEENENYEKYYPIIANKNDVDKQGYFWLQKEAKIVKEGSMVLFGSNSATHIIYHKEIEAVSDTSKQDEPSIDTQKAQTIDFLTSIKFN